MLARAFADICRDIYDAMLPPICSVCGDPVRERHEAICDSCRAAFRAVGRAVCPLCGAAVVRSVKRRCPRCPREPVYFASARAAYLYQGALRDAIHAFKYKRRMELRRPLARAMFMNLAEFRLASEKPEVLVAVPMHFLRRTWRGYNHAEELARDLAELSGVPAEPGLLVRSRHTPRQALLPPERRARSVFGAFEAPYPDVVRGLRVALVDDVFTSGSTVNECARVLAGAGAASVEVLALSRA